MPPDDSGERAAAGAPDHRHPTESLGPPSGEPLSEILGLDATAPAHDPLLGAEIGGVRIVRLIAQGGMGRVYEGRQDRPSRTVAVKVMRPGLATPSMMRRFEYEAEILARLRHPGIAQIFSAGVHPLDGVPVPYFVMEYISDARTLIRYADDLKLPTRARLDLFRSVCDAVAHGHQRGVIHRDLKPSNILVDASGHPKVIDFGVAKATDADLALTTMQTDVGQLVGTLQYMGPEQLAGDPNEIDVRCDVYALGVVLYELLTGKLPYDVRQKAALEVMRIVREEEPKPISSVNRTVRRDVAVIAGKCLEKDRARRYPTAGELAADVARHLAGEPITASPPGFIDGVVRLARRHRVAAAATAAVLTALVVALAAIAVFATRAERQRREADGARDVAQRQRELAEKERRRANEESQLALDRLYQANLYRIGRMIADGDQANANAVATEVRQSLGRSTVPLEFAHYQSVLDQSAMVMPGHTSKVNDVAFSPDDARIASASSDSTVRVWDAITGASLAVLRHEAPVTAVSYSPNGRLLATGGHDRRVSLWDCASGTFLGALAGHTAGITAIKFSPDGRLVASSAEDRTVRIWLVDDRTPSLTLKGHSLRVQTLAFSPDGKTVASAGWDYSVRLWDLDTGREKLRWKFNYWIQGIAFSPCGSRLAVATRDKTILVRSLTDDRPTQTLTGHLKDVFTVAFSPDGKTLASGGRDGSVRVWDAAAGTPVAVLPGHTDSVNKVAFSADGTRLASVSTDGTTRMWDVHDTAPVVKLAGHRNWVNAVAFSPDGKWLASGSWDGTTRIWSVEKAALIAVLKGDEGRVYSVAFSPDGNMLATASERKVVRLWNLRTGQTALVLDAHSNEVFSVTFSPDGTLLASGGGFPDGRVRLWRVPSGEPLAASHEWTQFVYGVAFSPDGDRVAAAGGPPKPARLLDLAAREVASLPDKNRSMDAIGYHPSGEFVATGSDDGSLRLRNATSLDEIAAFRGHNGKIHGLAFSPDGKRLVTASADFTVRLWDVDAHAELLSFHHPAHMRCVACSPRGDVFVAGGGVNVVSVYGLSRARVYAARLKSAAIRERLRPRVAGWFDSGQDAASRELDTAKQDLSDEEYHETLEMVLERSVMKVDTAKPVPLEHERTLPIASGMPVVSAADVDTPRPATTPQATLRELLRDRLAQAERALEATQAAYDAGTVTFDRLLDAVNKHAEAESAAATTDAERIAAAEKRVNSLRVIEQKIEALQEEQVRGGEADTFHVIKRERLSAEIDLIHALRMQPGGAEHVARKSLDRKRALVEGAFALKCLEAAEAALSRAEEARERSPGAIAEADLERLRTEVARSLAIVKLCELRAEEAGLAGLEDSPARRPVEAIRKDLLAATARRDELKSRRETESPGLPVAQERDLELLEAELDVLRLERQNALSTTRSAPEGDAPSAPEAGVD